MLRIIFVIISIIFLGYSANAAEITMAAGAGLKDVLNEISASFMQKNSDIKITKSIVVSGILAKQMDSGANIDIVFTANRHWMDYLKEKKHVNIESITPFAYNILVFAGKDPKRADNLEGIVKLNKIAIGAPRSVPAGEYAIETFKKAGINGKLEKKLVMARDVRECLLYAERGEVDGSFIYKTDALLSSAVSIWFTVPQKYYSRVVYLYALSKQGANNSNAVNFFNFIKSDEGKKIILKYGFEVQ